MRNYKIVYTMNEDLQRCFIEVEANDRQGAIKSLQSMGRVIGLDYKIVSCRLTGPVRASYPTDMMQWRELKQY